MQTLEQLLLTYGESHQNKTNKLIHWICVPSIMFSLVGLLMSIPLPFQLTKTMLVNWASVFFIFAWIYYLRLSVVMFICFVIIGFLMLWGNFLIWSISYSNSTLALFSLCIFTIAWVGQFVGHKIEGKKPSFLQDLQFLLIGPAWLLHFIFDKISVKY
jgi:uncharacterized membrane protein YGL010W